MFFFSIHLNVLWSPSHSRNLELQRNVKSDLFSLFFLHIFLMLPVELLGSCKIIFLESYFYWVFFSQEDHCNNFILWSPWIIKAFFLKIIREKALWNTKAIKIIWRYCWVSRFSVCNWTKLTDCEEKLTHMGPAQNLLGILQILKDNMELLSKFSWGKC